MIQRSRADNMKWRKSLRPPGYWKVYRETKIEVLEREGKVLYRVSIFNTPRDSFSNIL